LQNSQSTATTPRSSNSGRISSAPSMRKVRTTRSREQVQRKLTGTRSNTRTSSSWKSRWMISVALCCASSSAVTVSAKAAAVVLGVLTSDVVLLAGSLGDLGVGVAVEEFVVLHAVVGPEFVRE